MANATFRDNDAQMMNISYGCLLVSIFQYYYTNTQNLSTPSRQMARQAFVYLYIEYKIKTCELYYCK